MPHQHLTMSQRCLNNTMILMRNSAIRRHFPCLLIDSMTMSYCVADRGFFSTQFYWVSSTQLFNLSCPEREVMEKFITESLATDIIRLSSSPLGAGFFFVEKRDKFLRPCVNYRGLNSITIKNIFLLLLLSSAFKPLQGA